MVYQHTARKAKGWATWAEPDKRLKERDTLQCVHCGGHWFVEPGSGEKRGWCMNCNGPHCGRERCWTCVPFEKWLDIQERAARFAEAVGLQR